MGNTHICLEWNDDDPRQDGGPKYRPGLRTHVPTKKIVSDDDHKHRNRGDQDGWKNSKINSSPARTKELQEQDIPTGKAYIDMSAMILGRRAEMTARMVEFGGVLKAPAPAKPMIKYITQEKMRESQTTR